MYTIYKGYELEMQIVPDKDGELTDADIDRAAEICSLLRPV